MSKGKKSDLSLELAKIAVMKLVKREITYYSRGSEERIANLFDQFYKKFKGMPRILLLSYLSDISEDGDTLLYCAVREGRLRIVQFLVLKHLDISVDSIISGKPESNLALACRYGYKEICQYFLREGVYSQIEIKKCVKIPGIDLEIKQMLVPGSPPSCLCSIF